MLFLPFKLHFFTKRPIPCFFPAIFVRWGIIIDKLNHHPFDRLFLEPFDPAHRLHQPKKNEATTITTTMMSKNSKIFISYPDTAFFKQFHERNYIQLFITMRRRNKKVKSVQ